MNQIVETMNSGPAYQPQILLMEDEFSVAEGLKMILKEEGYGVDLATTGQKAIDTLNHKGFDLLVADLRLPDMDGMDVIERLKYQRPETEIIVITGYASVPSAVKAMKTGVVEYLAKPFTDDEFKTAVEGALKEKSEVHHEASPTEYEDTNEDRIINKGAILRVLNSASDIAVESWNHEVPFMTVDRIGENYRSVVVPDEYHDAAKEAWQDSSPDGARSAETPFFQQHLVEQAIEGIIGCDQDGKILIFNKSMEKMLGYNKDKVVGKIHFDRLFQVGMLERFREALYTEDSGSTNQLILHETDLLSNNGQNIPVQLSATFLFDEGEEIGLALFLRDLRKIRVLDQQSANQSRLLQQHKMISLGRLAASVVHEINNPLSGMLNYIRLMIKILNRGSLNQEQMDKFHRYLDLIGGETARCSEIVSNMLAFSRISNLEFCDVNLFELLEKSIMLSQHKLDLQNIEIRKEFDEKIPAIWGNFNQIQQCIINLIFNAIDAMPDGGILTIGCKSSRGDDVVEIRVTDTGSGIPPGYLPNIFDPFFTTKAEGEGLGLGLATVHGIIEKHNGGIDVESQTGKGTTFTIKLQKEIKDV